MDWFLYVLRCSDDSLYTGITTDVDRRVSEHNGSKLGAKYTKGKRPVALLQSFPFPDRSAASRAEWQFKKLSRRHKEQVLSGNRNPPWGNSLGDEAP